MFYLLDTAAQTVGPGSLLPVILIYVAFFVVIYFVAIRPSKKRQKQTESMQNAITNGDWVLLNNGMYGKVVNAVNNNLMVELGTGRSVIVPVRRDQIVAKEEPDLTEKTYEEVEKAPEDAVIGDDLAEDQLDSYDQYILEKGSKKNKKNPFGSKKQ